VTVRQFNLWKKITRKSKTKQIQTLPTNMKIKFIEITILSKEDKL